MCPHGWISDTWYWGEKEMTEEIYPYISLCRYMNTLRETKSALWCKKQTELSNYSRVYKTIEENMGMMNTNFWIVVISAGGYDQGIKGSKRTWSAGERTNYLKVNYNVQFFKLDGRYTTVCFIIYIHGTYTCRHKYSTKRSRKRDYEESLWNIMKWLQWTFKNAPGKNEWHCFINWMFILRIPKNGYQEFKVIKIN